MNAKKDMRLMDMTQGNSMRLMLFFAIPLFIGNIFQQIYSMVDTMVAGYNLGDSAIAAIGVSSSLYALLIDFASGFNSGCAIVVTQCFGAHDEKKLKTSIAGMMELDFLITIVLTIIFLLFLRPLMHFMNTPEVIFEQAYHYIAIICIGMAAAILYNMYSGILRAFGNSLTSLYFLIFSSVVNIGLDVLFVVIFPFGIAGAALATVIAEGVSAWLSGIYVYRHYRKLLPEKEDFFAAKDCFAELLFNGMAMALMYCVVDLGSVIFQRANNHLGERIISAHTAARRIIMIMMQPLATISTASSTFVGQNWGAGNTKRIHKALKQVTIMEVTWSLFACVLIYAFGGNLVHITTGSVDSDVICNAVTSLWWHLSFFPALGCLLVLRTAMQAMGNKMAPILSSCIELGMKVMSALWLIPHLGFLGTCITEPIIWVVMLLFLGVAYAFKKRDRNKMEDDRL